jgi:hypothetical protein
VTFLDAYLSGVRLTIELTGRPESRRRITRLERDPNHDLVLIFDGQEDDPWATRPPTMIDMPLPDDGPPWVTAHHTIREIPS